MCIFNKMIRRAVILNRKQTGLMEKQDLDTDTDMDMDTDICTCTMVGLDYWTYPYYLF